MGSSDELKKGEGLVDLIFSWSLADVLNKDLYKTQVKPIPETFSSTKDYMDSFIYPLIEETHCGLSESIQAVHHARTREIWTVNISKDFKPPKDLYYNISMNRNSDASSFQGMYEPKFGDLIALTEVRPKCIRDLDRPKSPYLIAVVQRVGEYGSEKIEIRASKPIMLGEYGDLREDKILFVVYLGNFITEIRIWTALMSKLEGENMNIIKRVLQLDSTIGENCTSCSLEGSSQDVESEVRNATSTFKLDDSQQDAVLSCVATGRCRHQNTVKLIWGPPGTGKTKTVASLLFVLLRLKCKTLTCAPTDIAVFGVASRLVSLLSHALEYDTYGLGDIVLFGIGERMQIDDVFLDSRINIDDREDIYDLLLDYRVYALSRCLSPLSGWKHYLQLMICLLEDPEEMYRLYLEQEKKKNEDDDKGEEEEESSFENQTVNSNEDEEEDIGEDLNDEDKKKEEEEEEPSKREEKLQFDSKREEKENSTQSNKEKGEKAEKDENDDKGEEEEEESSFENQTVNSNEDEEEDIGEDLNDGDKKEEEEEEEEPSKREEKLQFDSKREEKENSTQSNKEKGEKAEKDEDDDKGEEEEEGSSFENQTVNSNEDEEEDIGEDLNDGDKKKEEEEEEPSKREEKLKFDSKREKKENSTQSNKEKGEKAEKDEDDDKEEAEEEESSFENQIVNSNEDEEEDIGENLNDGDKKEEAEKEPSKREEKLKFDSKREEKENSTQSNKEKGEKAEKDEDDDKGEEEEEGSSFENQTVIAMKTKRKISVKT